MPSLTLTAPTISHLQTVVGEAISRLTKSGTERQLVLILDNPDLLLAATTTASPARYDSEGNSAVRGGSDGREKEEGLNAISLYDCINRLRQRYSIYHTVVAVNADAPLMKQKHTPTPLESNHVAFVMSLAHSAQFILSFRPLETGFAADVSGIVRVSRGPGIYDYGDNDDDDVDDDGVRMDATELPDVELLYHVSGDGGVRVFERGST